MAISLKYGKIDIPNIPDDEPVFIIRAQDSLSVPVISEYLKLCVSGAGGYPIPWDDLHEILDKFSKHIPKHWPT